MTASEDRGIIRAAFRALHAALTQSVRMVVVLEKAFGELAPGEPSISFESTVTTNTPVADLADKEFGVLRISRRVDPNPKEIWVDFHEHASDDEVAESAVALAKASGKWVVYGQGPRQVLVTPTTPIWAAKKATFVLRGEKVAAAP